MENHDLKYLIYLTLACCTWLAGSSDLLYADEWPQWRGPNRDGKSAETGLLKSWPSDGPRLVWTARGAGVGYSTPSISDGRMFLMGDRGQSQYVVCYNVQDGRELWSVRVGRNWTDPDKWTFHGARSTPTVEDNRLYALGTHGDLVCLRTTDGRLGWKRNIFDDFNGQTPYWGASESPLIEGDKLLVMAGGEQATIVALDKMTGDTIWKSHNPNRSKREKASFASMVASDVDGQRQIIAITHIGGYAARASDGKYLWDFPMGGASSSNTPVVHNGVVFFTSCYGPGSSLVNASPAVTNRQIYLGKALRTNTGGQVLVDGFLYGCHCSGGLLTCVSFNDGEVKWRERCVGDASISYADGRLYYRSSQGPMLLIEPSSEGYNPISRFNPPERSDKPAWAHPVISGGRLYLREMDHVHCYDIAKEG